MTLSEWCSASTQDRQRRPRCGALCHIVQLAVIMHQMWTTGEAFRWSSEAAKGKPTAA